MHNFFKNLYDNVLLEKQKKEITEDLLNNLAKSHFQYDNVCSNGTGYVLTDGSCLDFSGFGGKRELDHREINSIFMELDFESPYNKKNKGSFSGYMLSFLDIAKAIRTGFGNQTGFVSLIHNANVKQSTKIENYFKIQYDKYGEIELCISLYDNMYNNLKEKTVFEPTYISEILENIELID